MPDHVTRTKTDQDRLFTGRLGALESVRLMRCCVLVAGLGNIGALLAILLARLGVGLIRLVDRDRLEAKNLRNQSYGQPADVDRWKTDVMADQIHQLNRGITIDTITADLADVPLGKFADVDVCLGCLDSLSARQLLSERTYTQGVPLVDGGVDAAGDWLGKVHGFLPGGACLECSWSEAHYQHAAMETPCDPSGDPTGPATLAPALLGTAVASVMAAETAKLLLGHRPQDSFELAFDLASRRWLQSRLRPGKQCRFHHRVIDDVVALPVHFGAAMVGDLLAVIADQFGDSAVQIHFRRKLLDHGPLGSSRFPSVAALQNLSGQWLSDIGLTVDDRIRIDGSDRSIFIALSEIERLQIASQERGHQP